MTGGNRKLPDDEKLRRDAAAGYGLAQIAARYSVSTDHLNRHLRQLKIKVPNSALPAEDRSDFAKYVIERKVSATEYGGSIVQRISLPRISMHVAAREGRP
ncbi:hypothetical protein J2857_003580 [Neorhizobium galegae]|uniref:hypothetical protein n=1 Tax=Neorhizobium galegae TaxID=399 RepID=UPI001AEB0272|nr:hypothetical protein [Neorhizobium galegae]MBP2560811.1 hypothetical protein [Neorhizobium galegae]